MTVENAIALIKELVPIAIVLIQIYGRPKPDKAKKRRKKAS